MKRIIAFVCVLFLLMSVTACSDGITGMNISPSRFSDETQKVLKIFDDEYAFFDISVDDSVKSYSVNLYTCNDGIWTDSKIIHGKAEFLKELMCVGFDGKNLTVCSLGDDGGMTKGTFFPEVDFDGLSMTYKQKLATETPLELNKETTLLYILGTDSSSVTTHDITEDFRTLDCVEGIAVTLTVSDEIINY